MKITAIELRTEVKKIWPNLEEIWTFDSEYWCPMVKELNDAIAASKIKYMEYIPEINDCDDYALQLHAEIKRMRSLLAQGGSIPDNEQVSWAFGECAGTMFRGISIYHMLNICYCEEGGIILIDGIDLKTWNATPENDQVYYMRF